MNFERFNKKSPEERTILDSIAGWQRVSKFILSGGNDWVTPADYAKLLERDNLEGYIPWRVYREEEGVYENGGDNTTGFMRECVPHAFMGDGNADKLEALFSSTLPDLSVISFHLLADKDLEPILGSYRSRFKRDNPLIRASVDSLCEFFRQGAGGLKRMQDIPVRNFRLFVTCKLPTESIKEEKIDLKGMINTFDEILSNMGMHPQPCDPGVLLRLARRLTNVDWDSDQWCEYLDLNRQVILADSDLMMEMDFVRLGKRRYQCQTVKVPPKDWDLLKMNLVLGGIRGIINDTQQITQEFMVVVHMVKDKTLRADVMRKDFIVRHQKSKGSFGKTLDEIREETGWALGKYEKGQPLLQCIPMVWTWSEDTDQLDRIASRIKGLWKEQGFELQRDRGILPILFLSSLPFGLRTRNQTVKNLQREIPVPVETAVRLLPVQADFMGIGGYSMLFVGRKGQLVGMDPLSGECNNMNGAIFAGSGSGKSFVTNYMVLNMFGQGNKIRIVDIGGSYIRLCQLMGGVFMDFTPERPVCINPFGTINAEDLEELNSSIAIVAGIMALMAVPNRDPNKAESGLLTAAVQWAWDKKGKDAIIDDVQEFLNHQDRHYAMMRARVSKSVEEEIQNIKTQPSIASFVDGVEGETSSNEESSGFSDRFKEVLRNLGHSLAFALEDFSSRGKYGNYFCGPSNFKIKEDDFVVLELDYLKNQKELFRVVTSIVINAVCQELYLSDRKEKRFIIVDEAWQILNEQNGGGSSLLADEVEGGYRRARKYGGSFWTIQQSLTDLKNYGRVGKVIKDNASYKFLLQSNSFEEARRDGWIEVDDFVMDILKTVKTKKGYFSEIFVITDQSFGVMRLIIDRFNYYLFTSDSAEVAAIETMVKRGMTYVEAIHTLIRAEGELPTEYPKDADEEKEPVSEPEVQA